MNAAAAQLEISRIGQIAINVHELDRATAFYRDLLGLPFLFSAEKLPFFDCGGVRLMLSRPERPALDPPGSILYFVVPDIKAAHRQLPDQGVKFEGEPQLIARMPDHDLWLVGFRDSQQNVVVPMSEVPRA